MVTDAWVPEGANGGCPNNLVCEWPSPNRAGDELTLKYNMVFCVKSYSRIRTYTVPAGFKTDLASDPLDRRGTWDYGSVVHDYLYVNRGIITDSDLMIEMFSRKECDDIFYYIMQQCLPKDASFYMKLKNKVTWLAVRLFGARAWNS